MTCLSILGSTGSIGRQALAVCSQLGIPVVALACSRSIDVLAEQIAVFSPRRVAVADEEAAGNLVTLLKRRSIPCPEIGYGSAGYEAVACIEEADTVLAAMVGFAGLPPTLAAIRAKKRIALANKETLVTAGHLVMREVQAHGVDLLPVDSEHSAIWQCLMGGKRADLSRIFLTASGGPFRHWNREALARATAADALRHPTWKMGAKITIDSATLMNKGLEVIEACHLFQVQPKEIEVLIHPESIIHSMIEWRDGSVLAQLGFPDMRLPIELALTWPERGPRVVSRFNPFSSVASTLHFEQPRREDFPLLDMAASAFCEGGLLPTVLNAANEVAVAAFLEGKLTFPGLANLVYKTLTAWPSSGGRMDFDERDIMEADQWSRAKAKENLSCTA